MRLINKGPATAPRSRTGTDISNLQQPASLTLPAQLNGPPQLSDVHFLCSPVYEKGPWSTAAMYSFTKRKKIVDVSPHVQRICNITTPNFAPIPMGRSDNRYNRAIPTLLGPWQDDHPLVEECIVGLTTNLSDRGVGLVLYQPFLADEVVVGYWVSSELMHNPLFFLGNVRRNQPIGGGFWLVGIEFTEYANAEHAETLAALFPLAATLLSPAEKATV
jgi:hypothetical protein